MSNPDNKIHEGWRVYRKATAPADLDEAAVNYIRDAFYAGALTMIRELLKSIRPDVTRVSINAAITQLYDEVKAYARRVLDAVSPR